MFVQQKREDRRGKIEIFSFYKNAEKIEQKEESTRLIRFVNVLVYQVLPVKK